MRAEEILDRVRDTLTIRQVFGEPYERNGTLIVPVARLVGGGGGGGGEGNSPAGGGGGGRGQQPRRGRRARRWRRVRLRGAPGRRLRHPWRRGGVAARRRRDP